MLLLGINFDIRLELREEAAGLDSQLQKLASHKAKLMKELGLCSLYHYVMVGCGCIFLLSCITKCFMIWML